MLGNLFVVNISSYFNTMIIESFTYKGETKECRRREYLNPRLSEATKADDTAKTVAIKMTIDGSSTGKFKSDEK